MHSAWLPFKAVLNKGQSQTAHSSKAQPASQNGL
ncbi:hypothetical protein CTAM01_01780 [Colletotrichum tamarilloi]|uniref:Uncharacterized protein n=1 Tax=Colletotrichum tamarilloi TaxID=1209934 RepID=A0ABQ9RPJ7_9PEZI|nr:uncharacterized protein CTAM01_01780 [Colletotrichum tamarilloi]KAK1509657.1 hypothetical protein CTAM01_01780 [Colletotrichum tamarilloi]